MGQGLVYATGNRGADHMSGDCYEVGRGRIIPELGLDLLDRFEQSEAQALMAARTMDYRSFANSAILCHFEDPQIDNLVSLLRSIAGIEADYAWIARKGERITNLKRALTGKPLPEKLSALNLPEAVAALW